MSEAQLRFKMKSKLNSEDYARLTGFLDENTGASIELFPGMDFESMSISPLVIAVESFGYKLNAKIIFKQPIGFEVYENLKLNEEMRDSLSVNRRDFKLSKTIAKPTEACVVCFRVRVVGLDGQFYST